MPVVHKHVLCHTCDPSEVLLDSRRETGHPTPPTPALINDPTRATTPLRLEQGR
jgi:hypothetical protein